MSAWREYVIVEGERNIRKAVDIINNAQMDLHRILSDGEREDLLVCSTKWSRDLIRAIVDEIGRRQ